MKNQMKLVGLLLLTPLLLIGCGDGFRGAAAPPSDLQPGDGGGPGGTPTPGALETGGAGLAIDRVVTAAGTTVTANFSTAVAVNDDAQVVGLAEVTPGSPFVAALWRVNTAGSASVAPTALAPLVSGGFAAAFAIDAAGTVVGQASAGTKLVAVAWPTPTAPVALPALANGTGVSAAYAISADGTLVVGEAVDGSGTTRAVIWRATADAFTTPPSLLPVNIFAKGSALSTFSSANGVARVSEGELLVVGETEAGDGGIHAALWRSIDGGGSFTAVDLGADYVANAVNSARQVVGESNAALTPVVWEISAQGVASAPSVLAAAGSAVAINGNGRIAGWSGAAGLATVWFDTTPATLYATPSQAYALNNAVQPLVVGRNGSAGFVKLVD